MEAIFSRIVYHVEVINEIPLLGSLKDDLCLKPSDSKISDIILQTKAVKERSLQDLISHWCSVLVCFSGFVLIFFGWCFLVGLL